MYILTDLDNDLIKDEVYSGISTASLDAMPLNPSGPVSLGIVKPPKAFQNPVLVTEPLAHPVYPGNNGGDDGMSTEPVDENLFPPEPTPEIIDQDGIPGGGGYGGGGGGVLPEEEVIVDESMMREAGCKVMNIDCKIFYGALIVLGGVGAYLYFKNKK